jgi:hypothetical protein
MLKKNTFFGLLIAVAILVGGYLLSLKDETPKLYMFLFVSIDSIASTIIGIILLPVVHYSKKTALKVHYLAAMCSNILVGFYSLSFISFNATKILWIEFIMNFLVGSIMLVTAIKANQDLE